MLIYICIVICYLHGVNSFQGFQIQQNYKTTYISLNAFLPKWLNPEVIPIKSDEEKENDIYNNIKPWRAKKTKYLTYNYLLWKESYRERFRTAEELQENVYIYTSAESRPIWERTKVEDLWMWPWLWSKNKVERLAWIQKLFYENVEAMSVQEHMEMDALFSEFDLVHRWGILRTKEMDVLNVIALNIMFWTDFNGVKPTDLGLRPDGSVRACPVQIHDCISSSNDPRDSFHYAPPFKWSRSKSPEQAFDEIKNIYLNYPKRGLRWSYGWIDRGGWKPQQFGGSYFYSQADTLVFRFTDDIEFVLDNDKREVQYRSSPRFGQDADWDVQRMRYNQFVRMLQTRGGWDVQPLPKLNWYYSYPYRFAQNLLDSSVREVQLIEKSIGNAYNEALYPKEGTKTLNQEALQAIDVKVRSAVQMASNVYEELINLVKPWIEPIVNTALPLYDNLQYEPRIAAILQQLSNLEDMINNAISHSSTISESDVLTIQESVMKLMTDKWNQISQRQSEEVKDLLSPSKSMKEGDVPESLIDNKDEVKHDSPEIQSLPQSNYKKYLDYFKEDKSTKANDDTINVLTSSTKGSSKMSEDNDLLDTEFVLDMFDDVIYDSPTSPRERVLVTNTEREATHKQMKSLLKFKPYRS